MQKKSFSWGIIILMFILFFPVGIWMLVKKMSDEKYNYLKNGKNLKTFGWILFWFGIFYLIMGLSGGLTTEDGTDVGASMATVALFICGGGLFMIIKGKQYMKLGLKFSRYVSIVNSVNNTSIDNIAAAYPTSYEEAVSDLQQMIDAGYFMNSYIDLNTRQLVMPTIYSVNNAADSFTVYNQQSNNQQTSTGMRTVKCENCGATNTIMHHGAGECEYCGSPLT